MRPAPPRGSGPDQRGHHPLGAAGAVASGSERCRAALSGSARPGGAPRGPAGPGPSLRRPRYPARGPDRPPPRRAARSTRRRPV